MKLFYTLILLSIFSIKSFAQETTAKTEKLRTFYYTFSGIETNEAVQKLELEIRKIANVKTCKCKFKPERKMGELYVQYLEPIILNETQARNKKEIEELLKEQLILSGYSPEELKEVK